jgi:5-hydroxyisourate hydrolase-like protein (transthyretin family)
VEEVIVRRHLGAIITALWAILLASEPATACSFSTPLIKGASSFKVKVVDYRERPMEGADIVLISRDKEVARFKSDAQGEALIGKLAPGLYDLSLDQDVVSYFAQGYGLEVVKESKGEKELIFHWPAYNVISTSVLSGKLRYWETAPGGSGPETLLKRSRGEGTTHTLAKTELSLFKFGSKEMVAKTGTDDEGRFDFRVVEPGLYYMRFKFESYAETVVLDLDPAFVQAAPFVDVLIDDVVICGNVPQYRSLWPVPSQSNPWEQQL